MMGLTPKATQLLTVIVASFGKRGYAPTYDEMRDALGFRSKNSIAGLLCQLEDRGYITRRAKQARAIELLNHPSPTICCPNCSHEFEPARTSVRGETLDGPRCPSAAVEGEFQERAQ